MPSRVFERLRAAGFADVGSFASYAGVPDEAGTTGECVVGDQAQSTAAIASGPEEVDDPVVHGLKEDIRLITSRGALEELCPRVEMSGEVEEPFLIYGHSEVGTWCPWHFSIRLQMISACRML